MMFERMKKPLTVQGFFGGIESRDRLGLMGATGLEPVTSTM
jgi:hypothetical protein